MADANEIAIQQIPDVQWGKTGYLELRRMAKRHPASHGDNIERYIQAISPSRTDNNSLHESISLSDNEFEQLGKRLRRDLILSKVSLSKKEFVALAMKESQRENLAQWFREGNVNVAEMLEFINSIELRLFTDGQELRIGWEKTVDDDKGWVMRTTTLTDEKKEKINKNLIRFQGLIPQTRIFHNGKNTLFLSEFIDGDFATADDIVLFRKELADKGLDEKDFDLNQGNVIRTKGGKLIYVDGDYLGI